MTRLAEFRLKANGLHERLVILLPDWQTAHVAADHDAFHVVRKHIARDPHVAESVDHPDEQVFLLGIREELNVPLSAMMADHCKACSLKLPAAVVQNFGEAPIHLEGLSRFRGEPPASVALWSNELPLCRDQVLMLCDVVLNRAEAAGIAHGCKAVIANG